MKLLQKTAIWVSGSIGFGLVGGFFGSMTERDMSGGGFFAGILLFACLRLWLTETP